MNRVDQFEDRKLLEALYNICRSYIITLLKYLFSVDLLILDTLAFVKVNDNG